MSYSRHLFHQEWGHVTCAAMHKPSHVLVVGFTSGIFGLFEVPEFNPIHTLRCSKIFLSLLSVSNYCYCIITGAIYIVVCRIS